MAEPRLRFKKDDGSSYPPLVSGIMDDYFTERNEPGDASLPFLTVSIHSGISDGELDEESLGKRVNRISDPAQNKKVEAGDLVFNMMRAWQGAVGCAKSTGMVSPAYIVAVPNSCIHPPYMDLYVKTKPIIDQFNRLSYGALDFRKRLYWDSFIDTRVFLPCLEEQRKIADFMSSVDELITASEQEVANLETQKKTVMKKLFSQEVRFKRPDGTGFPEWEEIILTNILSEYKEMCEKDGTYEHVSLTKEGVVPKTERYERDFLVTTEDKKYRVTHLNDICYNPANLKFGVICRNKYKDAIFSPIYVTFTVNDKYAPEFIEMVVTNEAFIQRALKYQQGTVYERMAVSPADLLQMTVGIPCLEEQRLIADFLSDFDEAIVTAKKELELWKELKKGLLQQMFV